MDRILFSDGQALGVRSDYNGVLLLDSILQKTISDGKEEVKLELPLSEVIRLMIFNNSLINSYFSGYHSKAKPIYCKYKWHRANNK